MNWDRVQGNWKQVRGKVKQQWGKLTDDSLVQINGEREELIGKIQEAYGVTRDEADRQVRQTIRRVAARNPNAQIIVTGCYAQRAPEELAHLPQVRHLRKQVACLYKIALMNRQGIQRAVGGRNAVG